MEDRKSYGLMLDEKDMEKLREIANKDERSLSYYIRKLVSEFLHKNEID